jgi:SAM-dependent methyltransferase
MDLIESGSHAVALDRRHPWELARVDVVERLLRDPLELRPGDLVLDVGCGDAFVTEQIASLYPSVTFCGIDTAFDEHLLGTFTRNLTVRNVRLFSTLEEAALDIRGRQATVVLLLDVLEHIQDDVAFLKRLQASPLIGARTTYVVSAPAFESLFTTHDVLLGHRRRYSNKELRRHLNQADLEPLLLFYFFTSLLLPSLVHVMSERVLRITSKRTTQVARWNGSKPWQNIIRTILLWDFCVSRALHRRGITLPGLSNLAICRRPA